MSYTADSWSLSLLTLRVLVGSMAMKLVFLLLSVQAARLSHGSTGLDKYVPSLLHLIILAWVFFFLAC